MFKPRVRVGVRARIRVRIRVGVRVRVMLMVITISSSASQEKFESWILAIETPWIRDTIELRGALSITLSVSQDREMPSEKSVASLRDR